jgi:hypothetical protein
MLYFFINASICHFSCESHIVWILMIEHFASTLKNPAFLKSKNLIILSIFCWPSCLRDRCAWFTRIISPTRLAHKSISNSERWSRNHQRDMIKPVWYTRKNAQAVTGLQTSCYKSVHKVVLTSLIQSWWTRMLHGWRHKVVTILLYHDCIGLVGTTL